MMNRHKWIIAIALLCGSAFAGHSAKPATDWRDLRAKTQSADISEERAEDTLAQCRNNGMTLEETERLLSPVYSAHAEQLAASCIFLKIEEGLAKQIPIDLIRTAAEKRLNCMRRAHQLIHASQSIPGGQRGQTHLLNHTCMAIESGLPEEVLKTLFTRPEGFRPGRIVHVIEAGESLQLAGLTSEQTQLLMNDCLKRDLNRMEIFHMLDHVIGEFGKGRDFHSIHQKLWVESNGSD